ncbi:MAG: prephenate dehydrogenase/arogenate dehydrogenase family protein [Chloroflexi bacterium]|nr:prephenate dehydrogenase/arogenate dehydrogenase family protein [Chloroflexota bacterium]
MAEPRQSPRPDGPVPGPIALLGLGLIGGSIARALRGSGRSPAIVAWTPSGGGPRAALAAGVIDRVADSVADAVSGAARVILAGPPLAILDLLAAEAATLRSVAEAGATLTDVASTKARIVAAADAAGGPFVGGHPMAGRETTGFQAADTALFTGRPWVVVPGAMARGDDVRRVDALARAVGADPVRLSATEHDAAVAGVSHLPLVAAAALVEAVTGADDWSTARELAASGWAGMTRLARGDAEMGAGILATNREAVADRLRAYRAAIDVWIAAIEDGGRADIDPGRGGGVPDLRQRLEAARARLEVDSDG